MAMEQKEYLKAEAARLHIDLSPEQLDQFVTYYEMLVEKNKVMNLTGITEYEEVVKKHFVDSLSIVKVMDMEKVESVVDMGTGAGFPGIPLKIAFPHLQMTLVDSLAKRIGFLNEVIEALDLTEIEAVHGRAEDMARDRRYREMFDLCTSRAVARLSALSEYCLPFVKVGGVFLSYKAGDSEEEISEAAKAIKVLGGKLTIQKSFALYDMGRTMVGIKKVKATPKTYPRKAGTPTKKPIV